MTNSLKLLVAISLGIVSVARLQSAEAGELQKAPTPLKGAHAHNDYYHKRPLWDALELGFTSIEADVFLVEGQLLVGHYAVELRPERSLKTLYLDPLRQHIEANRGRVFADDERLTLLIDFKSDGAASYTALARLLAEYDGIVSRLHNGKWTPGAVDVVISGNRPVKEITADPARRVAIDGRFADTPPEAPVHLYPMISENWGSFFDWRGGGDMPADQRRRLRDVVRRAHDQGRRLRFWGAPSGSNVWSELRAEKVDVLGADDLKGLHQFLTQQAD